jgi:hypothetical protein
MIMETRKRGDHLVATGLAKTIGDVAATIKEHIGDSAEGKILYSAVSQCSRFLTGGAFDAVINRGRPVLFADAHSVSFGEAVRLMKLEMGSLVVALKSRREIDVKDQALRSQEHSFWDGGVSTSKKGATLAVGRFIDEAIDTEVERRLRSGPRGESSAVRANLEWVRSTICEAIQKM